MLIKFLTELRPDEMVNWAACTAQAITGIHIPSWGRHFVWQTEPSISNAIMNRFTKHLSPLILVTQISFWFLDVYTNKHPWIIERKAICI